MCRFNTWCFDMEIVMFSASITFWPTSNLFQSHSSTKESIEELEMLRDLPCDLPPQPAVAPKAHATGSTSTFTKVCLVWAQRPFWRAPTAPCD